MYNGISEVDIAIAHTFDVGVGHAAVKVAVQEPLANLIVGPAVFPVGLHRDDVQFAELAHTIDHIDNHTRKLVVVPGLLRAIQSGKWRVVDILSQDNLRPGTVLGNARQGWD